MSSFWSSIAGLCFLAAAGMYIVGGNNPNLTELREFFWAPIPVGVIALFISNQPRK